MGMRDSILQEKSRLEKRIQRLEKSLQQAPEGTFYTVTRGKNIQWYSCIDGKRVYIRKKDREKAKRLALKQYYRFLLNEMKKDLQAASSYLRLCSNFDFNVYLEDHPEIRELIYQGRTRIQKVRDWEKEPYEHSAITGKYQYKTLKGDLVKSLTEKNIADALFVRGIPYRYECRMVLSTGSHVVYPDFVIMDPATGNIYIWEHFGMSELSYYQARNADKLYQYFINGYIPGLNLICTASDDKNKLTQEQIGDIIEFFFKHSKDSLLI